MQRMRSLSNSTNCRICQKWAWLMIPVSQERSYLQAPEAPKTPIKAILESIFKLKIKFEINVITYPTAINLSAWVPSSTGLVVVNWPSVTATTGKEWLAEPNIAVGRAIRTTPTRLTTDTLLSKCIPFKIGIKYTHVQQRPLDAKNFHLGRGLQSLPYTWVRGKSKRWHLTRKGTVESSRFQRGQKICEKQFEPKLNNWSGEGGPNKTSE